MGNSYVTRIRERLDLFLSPTWVALFPNKEVKHFMPYKTDHTTLVSMKKT